MPYHQNICLSFNSVILDYIRTGENHERAQKNAGASKAPTVEIVLSTEIANKQLTCVSSCNGQYPAPLFHAEVFYEANRIVFVVPRSFDRVCRCVDGQCARWCDRGDVLPFANVYLEEAGRGMAADLDGKFEIDNLSEGRYTLAVRFVGYKTHRNPIVVASAGTEVVIELVPEAFRGNEVIVIAERAKLRETPVAFSDVPKADMERKLGSRDLPMVLTDAPGVHATEQGGGSGDSRINVRGFDQRNVAVMINGVPSNDMENGWVYWSNWDGLSDVTSSIQVQRGLGASNLAIASVGGTLNIVTDIARQVRGFKIKQEAGRNAFYKTTVNFSSGLLKDKTAFTLNIARKLGEGLVDQTWTTAWSYFGALSFRASETHKLDLFLIGGPQRHGQRLSKQAIATFDADYARALGIDITGAKNYGIQYNANWGRSPFASYRAHYNGAVREARDGAIIMERENYYHKPQVNLNWYWTPHDAFIWVQRVLHLARQGRGHGAVGHLPRHIAGWQHRLSARCR